MSFTLQNEKGLVVKSFSGFIIKRLRLELSIFTQETTEKVEKGLVICLNLNSL